MTTKCAVCNKKIDTSHDNHYYCKCGSVYTAVCKQCHMSASKCPRCGKQLHHKEDSITKKIFHSPSTRNNLGF